SCPQTGKGNNQSFGLTWRAIGSLNQGMDDVISVSPLAGHRSTSLNLSPGCQTCALPPLLFRPIVSALPAPKFHTSSLLLDTGPLVPFGFEEQMPCSGFKRACS